MTNARKIENLSADVSFEEARAAAEAFWASMEAKLKAVTGAEPNAKMIEFVRPMAINLFLAGAGWMRSELHRKVEAVILDMLAVASEPEDKPN